MKRNTGILMVALLVLGLATLTITARGPGQGRGNNVPPIVSALDADGDGVIGSEEITNAPSALLTLDRDADGRLTQEEFRPAKAGGKGRQGGPDGRPGGPGSEKCDGSGRQMPKGPVMTALDADGDHVLDAAEVAAASSALLALDADGDGALGAGEYLPAPRERGGRGGGGSPKA